MNNNRSGIGGILGLAACVLLYIGARRFFPSLASILLWIAGIAVAVLLVLIGLVIYFSVKGGKEAKDPDSPAAILGKARADLMEIRRGQVKLKERAASDLCREIIGSVERILSVLKDKPDRLRDARQFLNYYLPTLAKIVSSYAHMESGGAVTAEMRDSMVNHLGEIRIAMEKQYGNLFEEDKLDLSVEMEALTLACRRDGLLDGEHRTSDEP